MASWLSWETILPNKKEIVKLLRLNSDNPFSHIHAIREWMALAGWIHDNTCSHLQVDLNTLAFATIQRHLDTLVVTTESKTLAPTPSASSSFAFIFDPPPLVDTSPIPLGHIDHVPKTLLECNESELCNKEYTAWRYWFKTKEKEKLLTSVEIRRLALASALIRFMRTCLLGKNQARPVSQELSRAKVDEILQQGRLNHNEKHLAGKIKEGVYGTRLQLGDIEMYAKINPTGLNDSLLPDMVLNTLGSDADKAAARADLSEVDEAKRSKNATDIINLYLFAYWYQTQSGTRATNFVEKFVIFWHQWYDKEAVLKLMEYRRNDNDRRPIIVHMGTELWLIFDQKNDQGFYFMTNSVRDALAVWLHQVKTCYNNKDEYHNTFF